MTGATAAAAPSLTASDLSRRIVSCLRQGDILLALGVVAILVVLILPLPRWLLDISLAFSITFSVLILLTGLFVEKPLEFNAFPTILLLSTMVRLALNMASTRLILTHGHEGTDAAGRIIEAFAGFIMGGNFVIGVIVFAILLIVNFVVITKGSTRIAEVSARFTLDAMPGKQMAIDADLSSGLINEDTARKRRQELEEESSFFGAMDGASKFVRGDAIAGLLITFINIIAGMIIGVAQNSMSLEKAADTFVRLTVGDGLVTQIPALIVATASGIVVTKAGLSTRTEKALFGQLGGQPKAMGIATILLVGLALLPNVPALPFLVLAVLTGTFTWFMFKREETRVAEAAAEAAQPAPPAEEPISAVLRIDEIRLEIGYGLLGLVSNGGEGPKLTDQIKAVRRQLAAELGFVVPSVRIQDNMQLAPQAYAIYVKDVIAGRGEVRPNLLLVMDPRGEPIPLPGEKTREPTFGLAATWIDVAHREDALFRGFTVVDASTVLTTHLTEVIKEHMPELLSNAETRNLLDQLEKANQKLVADLIPSQISLGGVQRVLQNLLAERVSIRDLPTILEGIAEACHISRSTTQITEHVRSRLARQICDINANDQGIVPLLVLGTAWDQTFAESLTGNGDDRQLALAPSKIQEFVVAARNAFERQAQAGESPVLLTSPAIRPYVRSVLERFRPMTQVMSQSEISPKARIRTVGQI
ncbi:MAG: flagellar biosynthesis protein FlhA [Rhodospirillales bacterium]